jgi:hypothetical protein
VGFPFHQKIPFVAFLITGGVFKKVSGSLTLFVKHGFFYNILKCFRAISAKVGNRIFVSIVPNDPPYVTLCGSYKCENLAEPVYVAFRSVSVFSNILDPFVAPNKIITHFLLIAVVRNPCRYVVADDNIGGVGFDPSTYTSSLYIDLYIPLYRLKRRN